MLSLFDQDFEQQHQQLLSAFNNAFKQEGISDNVLTIFKNVINHYHKHKRRSFAWREHITPYRVVVSEIMLQQTQTDRVAPKFDLFVSKFTSFEELAQAQLHDVIRHWKGLGYNRRAMSLQKIAHIIQEKYAGLLPATPELLESFPGIGHATARSITSFAFNIPTTFIETNIRTVFIYFFFKDKLDVHDKELLPLIEKTVDQQTPREWYYALMDYGVMLKKTVGNLCRLSKHYAKQSKFEGSDRQIRGKILQILLDHNTLPHNQLVALLEEDEVRVAKIVGNLCSEGFVKKNNAVLMLA